MLLLEKASRNKKMDLIEESAYQNTLEDGELEGND